MKTIQKLTVTAVAIVAMSSCCAQNNKPKFDAKEYAKHKTERIDNIVELSDAQEKEVYALYLAQGKEIKKNIKAAKKECGEMKRPDCKKAENCPKTECDKAKCDKPCTKKAECCDKAKCDKPCPKSGECAKPHKPMRRPHFVSPESKKATFEKLNTILTPEQSAKLKELHTKRHSHCSECKECIPAPAEK